MSKSHVRYEFDVLLDGTLTEDLTEHFYVYFGEGGAAPTNVLDVSLLTLSGQARAACVVESDSLEEALAAVLPKLRQTPLHIVGVAVDEEGLAVLEQAA